MEKKSVKSNLPILFLGATWVLYAIIFPLYRLSDFLIVLVASLAVFFVTGKLIPNTYVMVEKAPIKASTGNEKLDTLINEANGYISNIRKANDRIADEGVSQKITQIENITTKIFEYVAKNPDTLPNVRRFISYYLPTTLKLLDAYAELASQGVQTANITTIMKKIDDSLSTVKEAFEKQYDSLYDYKAMDISSEISVFEDILSSEGLIKNKSDGSGITLTLEGINNDAEAIKVPEETIK